MPVYSYTAIDREGKKRVGTVDARSEPSGVSLLKEQGLFVVSLEEHKESTIDQILTFKGVSDTELVAFTRQLSTMISAGLPIARALEVLTDQTESKKLKKILLDTLRDIQGGASLSSAIGKYPEVFSKTYIALVKAGESSGKLEEILQRLADTMEAQRDLASKFKGAMIYPAIIFLAMIGVFVLMMVFVIPKLADMYESMGVDLPAITKFMISASDIMAKFWWLLILLIGGAVLLFKSFYATEAGRKFVSKILFSLPVFGKIYREKDLTEFARTLGLLISSGIPIVEALNIISQVVTNESFKQGALNASKSVEKGNSLSDYLKQDPAFPPIVGQMTAVGEETGQLDQVLSRVGEFFAKETDHAVKGLSAALEPIILIMLGGMVGVLIISIITPIYQITSSL